MADDTKLFDFHGIPIKIAPMEECAKATYLVCTLATDPNPFTDNKTAPCVSCGRLVAYRHYMPEEPAKICMECFAQTLSPSG